MEQLLFGGPEFTRLYNCTFVDMASVPIGPRQHLLLGACFITVSLVEELLYIPCMLAIWKLARENACYKMMWWMSLLDMCALGIVGLATGLLGMLGAVYCSSPMLIYILGSLAYGKSNYSVKNISLDRVFNQGNFLFITTMLYKRCPHQIPSINFIPKLQNHSIQK
jgi:hypothetical protein